MTTVSLRNTRGFICGGELQRRRRDSPGHHSTRVMPNHLGSASGRRSFWDSRSDSIRLWNCPTTRHYHCPATRSWLQKSHRAFVPTLYPFSVLSVAMYASEMLAAETLKTLCCRSGIQVGQSGSSAGLMLGWPVGSPVLTRLTREPVNEAKREGELVEPSFS